MTIQSILANIRALFFMDEEATEQEIDQRLTDELQAREAEDQAPTTQEAATGNPDDTGEETETVDELHTLRQTVTEQAETIQAQKQTIDELRNQLAELNERISAMEQMDASEPTGGRREASTNSQPVWMQRAVYNKLK